MAAISAFPASLSCRICRRSPTSLSSSSSSCSSSPSSWFPSLCLERSKSLFRPQGWNPFLETGRRVRAVAEEETLVPEEVQEKEDSPADQPVSVPVSPSDMLTMFFRAEGTMDESGVSTVTKALEEQEGISDLKVQIIEGIASVELTKQTTVQATAVASNLVEMIQGSGFRLQALNLSFEDEEDAIS